MKLFVLAKSIFTLPDPLYHYLQRPGSIMRSGNVDRNREILDAFDDLLSWFQEQKLLNVYYPILCRLCMDHVYLAASVPGFDGRSPASLAMGIWALPETPFSRLQKQSLPSTLVPLQENGLCTFWKVIIDIRCGSCGRTKNRLA